ncbi:MAG: methyltransferase domain-containing protein [Acidobacteria bacterium]|nr:methyltransferase domain-containing protein [Acidobacteriota bacterium]MCB9397632.1 methyltransferase domain-containing protein [Acidobacteriota bacterium]
MNEVKESERAAARTYESLFVPALFGQWPAEFLRLLEPKQTAILDLACGTGIVARSLRKKFPDKVQLTGLDPALGMLAVAKDLSPQVDWVQGVAESLPFPDRAFSAVLCQFGFMFFSDQDRALREMARVLAPGGQLIVAVWNAVEEIPAIAEEVALLEKYAGHPAAQALRAPFCLGDPQDFGNRFKTLNWAQTRVETVMGQAVFPSIRTCVEVELRGWLPLMGVHLEESVIQTILAEAEKQMAPFRDARGRAVFDISAHFFIGKLP